MRCKSLAAVLPLLLFSVSSVAQSPHMPQPAPELKKLDYFVGAWKADAEMKSSPYGPGGKITSTDQVEWMQGNFFLLIHSHFNSSMGSGTELGVMGYDPANKVYTYNSFNSGGEREAATGTLEGDTWTWNSGETPSPFGKWRFTQKMLSPTSYAMKFETSQNGTTWSTAMEGKATRQ